MQSSYSNMFSEVEIPSGFEGGGRPPLQGQPNYLASLQLRYRHLHSGHGVSLLYKRAGEELYIVSNTYAVPSVYRDPYNSLALSCNWRLFENTHLTLSVDNLLDEEHHYAQGGVSGDNYGDRSATTILAG